MLRAVWRHRWRVVIGTVLMAGVFFVRALTQPDIFEAVSRVGVVPGAVAAGRGGDADVRRLTLTVTELVTADGVARAAATDAGISGPAEVRSRTTASPRVESGTIIIAARAGSAAEAAVLSDALASAVVAAVAADQEEARAEARARADREIEAVSQRIDNPLVSDSERTALTARRDALVAEAARAQLVPVDRARITSPARAEDRPVSPRPFRDAAAAAVLAFLVNAGLAVAAERLSDRFARDRIADEVAAVAGAPVLAIVPEGSGAAMLEGIRALRTSLMFVSTPERLRTLAVLSAEPGAGRSSVALHLASEAAALGVAVVLVDADVRRPTLHARLGVEREPGLLDALARNAALEEVSVDISRPGDGKDGGALRFIPAGRTVDDPSALLGAGPLDELLAKLTWAELVVLDTPPGLATGDALSVAARCDASIVVVDAPNARRRQLARLVAGLAPTDAHLLGVVVTQA